MISGIMAKPTYSLTIICGKYHGKLSYFGSFTLFLSFIESFALTSWRLSREYVDTVHYCCQWRGPVSPVQTPYTTVLDTMDPLDDHLSLTDIFIFR
jgi:hypothetical protein